MNVLVIDDDLISRMALLDVLGKLPGLFPVEADSGERAWELLVDGLDPALCCCDVRMPGMSGIDLLRKMHADARFTRIPVLMVTSASDRDTVTEAIKLGAAGFIIKPFQADKVRVKVEEALGTGLEPQFENPAAAMKRLGIDAARYAAYVETLAGQVDAAVRKAGSSGLGKQGLDALHTGCLTVGATHCAAVIAAATKAAGDGSLSSPVVAKVGGLSLILKQHAQKLRGAA